MLRSLIVAFVLLLVTPAWAQDFQQWLGGVRAEAISSGVPAAEVDRALANVTYMPIVVERDQSQPEFVTTFWTYLDRATSEERVQRGRQALQQYGPLLSQISARYGVPARFIVAIWAAESNFGAVQGAHPVIPAIATRAYERRSSGAFRSQLIDAIRVAARGVPTERLVGSWAGAMGQPQFMPSAYLHYAVDWDGDGVADIWSSEADVFASIANYLASNGWRTGENWGREVRLPASFPLEQADLQIRRPVAEWARMGVRRANGGNLPIADMDGAIVLPAGHDGPAFLVYQNFRAIMAYNRAIFYALTIGHLADRFGGGDVLISNRPAGERALSFDEIREIQSLLTALGYDAGPIDGVPGSQTAAAIRAFQRNTGAPADGYASTALLNQLRQHGRS